jgi:hypothetical protein
VTLGGRRKGTPVAWIKPTSGLIDTAGQVAVLQHHVLAVHHADRGSVAHVDAKTACTCTDSRGQLHVGLQAAQSGQQKEVCRHTSSPHSTANANASATQCKHPVTYCRQRKQHVSKVGFVQQLQEHPSPPSQLHYDSLSWQLVHLKLQQLSDQRHSCTECKAASFTCTSIQHSGLPSIWH